MHILLAVLRVAFVFLFSVDRSQAQISDAQQRMLILKEIKKEVMSMCYEIEQKGNFSEDQVAGKIQAGVSVLFKRLGNLGVEGDLKMKESQFAGVLQQDLPRLMEHNTECRKFFFDKFYDIVVSEGQSGATNGQGRAPATAPPSNGAPVPSSWSSVINCQNGQIFRAKLDLNEKAGAGAIGVWTWSGSTRGRSEVTLSPSPTHSDGKTYIMVPAVSNAYSYEMVFSAGSTFRGRSLGREACSITIERIS